MSTHPSLLVSKACHSAVPLATEYLPPAQCQGKIRNTVTQVTIDSCMTHPLHMSRECTGSTRVMPGGGHVTDCNSRPWLMLAARQGKHARVGGCCSSCSVLLLSCMLAVAWTALSMLNSFCHESFNFRAACGCIHCMSLHASEGPIQA